MGPDPMSPWQPRYADDTDGPDPYDGGYHPDRWSRERMALAREEHDTDRQTGAYDETPEVA